MGASYGVLAKNRENMFNDFNRPGSNMKDKCSMTCIPDCDTKAFVRRHLRVFQGIVVQKAVWPEGPEEGVAVTLCPCGRGWCSSIWLLFGVTASTLQHHGFQCVSGGHCSVSWPNAWNKIDHSYASVHFANCVFINQDSYCVASKYQWFLCWNITIRKHYSCKDASYRLCATEW